MDKEMAPEQKRSTAERGSGAIGMGTEMVIVMECVCLTEGLDTGESERGILDNMAWNSLSRRLTKIL